MTIYEHTYEARGWGRFPTDMLRYDESHPADTAGAAVIENAQPDTPICSVILRRTDGREDWMPTIERWRSFGWCVVGVVVTISSDGALTQRVAGHASNSADFARVAGIQ